ncbi:hypothetical protein GE21DRAFT_4539 [Neurospora crassa]|uniref:Actin cytoskeleton organization protein App1 n=1 Tax=Neurospora crassa (strain ATCC 24698 / 74-OR23-1A / CBS 708.71 / DSM 1257 / FGSC 987) TaxID=367110 RepID=A7UVU1_NEUCR|nr:actin cytoskeleton organization protein App1 [Neurospora crassa OR74A]EDO65411.1 actin cytoskeleton organization protein App1 [Neurospora crassa OR74A]KHE89677.1 hypothetical protein GE21DRAFT_4539 [Neurospora crassa]|eukprot:XP_001728502.1 actin cytoskeleton organization protein App1 [Neurospora crassa OR74A]
MTSPYTHGYTGQYGANEQPYESGSRRRKLAAMAGSVYRAGVAAASEIREQYSQTRLTRDMGDGSPEQVHIPGAFPEVPIIHKGQEQLILFPSYAKRHVKGIHLPRRPSDLGGNAYGTPNGGGNGIGPGVDERDYWTAEWNRHEDEKAVVDVDIRGWIYMPPKGPMSRKNRMVMGVARRLSGLPQTAALQAGAGPQQGGGDLRRTVTDLEGLGEEERIAKEAREIERRGQGEKEAAIRGEYSERPRADDMDDGFGAMRQRRSPSPPNSTAPVRTNSGLGAFPSEMTEAELAAANASLNARLAPFMATPLVGLPITLFFYNDQRSKSKTIETNASGHFIARVPLDFVPTHFRVLANENISTTQPVEVIEPRGVSLISDVDDTIKRSNINGGAREIFRNTFVRELADQTIDGVKELYTSLHNMGVKLHYVSNSPWQLYPVLATFFHKAGLPPGSIDLKQYSGMLQGIFEPVAERKKGTLERILRDFPERKFLLVGDSGEADLEVYTDLALAYPGRILAVFIRDVTTPEQVDMGYFTSNTQATDRNNGLERSDSGRRRAQTMRAATATNTRDVAPPPPKLPPRSSPQPKGPIMGDLIDLSDDPPQQPAYDPRTSSLNAMHASRSTGDIPQRKGPPPRPAKPTALRSSPAEINTGGAPPPLPPKPRESPRPNTSHQNSSASASAPGSGSGSRGPAPPPPPPRRTSTVNLSQSQSRQSQQPPLPPPRRVQTTNSSSYDSDTDEWGLPLPLENRTLGSGNGGRSNTFLPVRPATSYDTMNGVNGASVYATNNSASGGGANSPVNKKLEIWLRRLAEAHELLEKQGVKLYTWREGRDVVAEAEGIVREAMRGFNQGVGGRRS